MDESNDLNDRSNDQEEQEDDDDVNSQDAHKKNE